MPPPLTNRVNKFSLQVEITVSREQEALVSYAKAFGQFVTDSEANSHCVDQAVAKANEVGDTFGQDGHKISSATAKGYTFFTKKNEVKTNCFYLPEN